jgi:hypothetical protein
MCGTMNVLVEVWAISADAQGLWLVNGGDAWRSPPIPQDSDTHYEVEFILAEHGLVDDARLVHSTSWRADGPHIILTYIVVVDRNGPVPGKWPEALPVSAELFEAVGPPPTNAAVDAPMPRYIDVLIHGIRHLRFLADYDATARAAMPPALLSHVTRLEPTLAGLYAREHAQD